MFRITDSNGNVKYAGRSKAVVLDNRDPLNKGRIIVDHPLLGETVWIDYLQSPSQFNIPSIGDTVYVECDAGVHEFPIAWGNAVKGEDSNPNISDIFKRDIPTNRGWHTPNGNSIELDDGVANITQNPDDTKFTTKSRGVRIKSKSGHQIIIQDDPDNGMETITIMDKSGDKVVLDSAAKKITISSSGDINVNASGNEDHTVSEFSVKASSTATVQGSSGTTVGSSGSTTTIDGQQVELGGGGTGVARVGDRAIGIGNLGAPVTSTIIAGSFKVFSS